MKILTVIRQVLDAEESVRMGQQKVDLDSSKLVIDNMDEYGVEEALRLREKGGVEEIVVLAIGPPRMEEAIRTALSMGADRAILVESTIAIDPIALSQIVAEVAKTEAVELVLCGGQQADWDSHALGAATAERLNWPQVTWTNLLTIEGTTVTGKHDVDAGSESFALSLPAVITCQQGLNEPRYPTLPNIMKSKKKEVKRLPLDSFGITPRLTISGVEVQVKERKRHILDGKEVEQSAVELVSLLRNEARIL